MKKIYVLALSGMLLTAACTKNRMLPDGVDTVTNEAATTLVSLNISGFGQQITPYTGSSAHTPSAGSAKVMAANTTTAVIPADVAKIYYGFYLFNEKTKNWVLFYEESQLKTTSGSKFGIFSHRFIPGKYRVLVYAGSADGSVFAGNAANPTIMFQSDKIITPEFRKESYYQLQEFSVGEDDINNSLTLLRGNGKMVVTLTDEWLTDFSKVTLTFDGKYAYKFNQQDSLVIAKTAYNRSVLPDEDFPAAFKGKSGATLTYYMPLADREAISTTVTLKGYNADGVELKRKVIENVRVENNKVTTVSGAFFKLANAPMNISFPADYSETISTPF